MSEVGKSMTFGPVRARVERLGGGGLRLAAPAKINLNLHVGPLRGDGYHDLDSYVAKITLYDEVTLHPRSDGRITLTCTGADCGDDERNLALRAARALAAGRNVGGVDIALVKRIAPGAGLGGGSSDAAAVLRGLRDLWRLDLDDAALGAVAATLGSDVPLFLGPPAARMTGRGERLAAVEVHPFFALLLVPDIHCATGEVYRGFDAVGPGALADQLPASVLGGVPSSWRGLLRNDLGAPARQASPPLDAVYHAATARIEAPLSITGSGSAMFILCDSPAQAADTADALGEDLRAICIPVRSNPW